MSFIETIRENTRQAKEYEKERLKQEKIKRIEFNISMLTLIKNMIFEHSKKSPEPVYVIYFTDEELLKEFVNSPYYDSIMFRFVADGLKEEGFETYFYSNSLTVNW